MRRLPMAFLAALATNGDTGTSRFHGSSWSVEPSDIILYQERGASEKIEVVGGRAPYWSA